MTIKYLINDALANGYDNFTLDQRYNYFNNNILGETFVTEGLISSVLINSMHYGRTGSFDIHVDETVESIKTVYISVVINIDFSEIYTTVELTDAIKSVVLNGQRIYDEIIVSSFDFRGKYCHINATLKKSLYFEKLLREKVNDIRRIEEQEKQKQQEYYFKKNREAQEKEKKRVQKNTIIIGIIGALFFLLVLRFIPNPHNRDFPILVYFIGPAVSSFAFIALYLKI